MAGEARIRCAIRGAVNPGQIRRPVAEEVAGYRFYVWTKAILKYRFVYYFTQKSGKMSPIWP